MNIEHYQKERKIQRLALMLVGICGAILALFFRSHWVNLLFGAVWVAFSFIFFHTAYLAIKYSLIELTTGVYTKSEKPIHYYVMVFVVICAGFAFLYRAATS
jgi:hypothetical protein